MARATSQEAVQARKANALDCGPLALEGDQAARDVAMTLLAQYGEDASVIATLRAAEVAAIGDEAALAHWDAVIEFLEAGLPPEQAN